MEPFEWLVAGVLIWAVSPTVRKALRNTWASLTATASQTVQSVERTTSTGINQTQNMFSQEHNQ